MRLKNRKTGEIGILVVDGAYKFVANFAVEVDGNRIGEYDSLAELNQDWEDYEEPEKYFWIDVDGFIVSNDTSTKDVAFETFKQNLRSIGNYFETREEAEKAREKLKAWKRLKSCGFKFKGWRTADLGADKYYFVITAESDAAGKGDLDLLFSEGGEE